MGRTDGALNKDPTKLQIYGMLVAAGIDLYGLGKVDTIKKSKLMEIDISHGVNVYEARSGFDPGRTSSGSGSKNSNNSKDAKGKSRIEDVLGLDDLPDCGDVPLNQEVLDAILGDIDENALDKAIMVKEKNSTIGIKENKGKEVAYIRTQWGKDIGNKGYIQANIRAPNKAVQNILGCILKDELHNYFITKELRLKSDEKSPILFLGFNGMIKLVNKFKDSGYDMVSCKNFIDEKYVNMSDIIFRATEKEVRNVRTFVDCLTVLEKANGIKLSYPPVRNTRVEKVKNQQVKPEAFINCLFDMNMLTEEERAEFEANGEDNHEIADPRITELNLFNCAGFPILAPREIELFGEQYYQKLWKSKNLGILAPINLDTWITLAGIQKEEIKHAHSDALNFIRRVDKMDITLPFDKDLLEWKCARGDGFFLGQKGHQVRIEEKRNDFYVKKMWRTFCPYLKCNCQNFTRDKGGACPDGILWFDHVVWCIMNNLDVIWPNKPPRVQFVFFIMMLQGPLRKAVIAYISYLKVRETLIGMTIRYSEHSAANLNQEFGNNKMTEILEKTVRPRSFLLSCDQPVMHPIHDAAKRKRYNNEENDSNTDFVMPPKIYKKPVLTVIPAPAAVHVPTIEADMEVQIVEDTPENSPDHSVVNLNSDLGATRIAGLQQTKLQF